jgi:pyrroloquinoline quinone (PQQ) biosynthesis protein C
MNRAAWRATIGEMVRENMRSPEIHYYFSVKTTKPRGQLLLKQLALFVRHRRDCWSFLSGNCPLMEVKHKILQHEYGEVIKDEYTDHGHLDLIVRQAKVIGLSADEVLYADPIPTTLATLYGWGWITREKHWIEGLAALTVTEWTNDDRLLADQGGGHSSRMAKKWMAELGLTIEELPQFKVHGAADEEHSDMFLPFLAEFATGEKEGMALQAVRESLALSALYREGVARAMEKLP